ncbi:MAG: class I SAM-dependent rRNA methyltransferase [Acidobacteria bacterium]|nr:class I SAM-dependent rRNA methyltransferase [Acidobacteriota bacterium]
MTRQPSSQPSTGNPAITISARGAERLRSGHVWVYSSDVLKAAAGPGSIVDVMDGRGRVFGTAFYSSSSQIALRLLSPKTLPAAAAIQQLIPERVGAAIDYRQRVVAGSDAYRLVFSEADGLPGLIVDRYGAILSLQILTQGMDSPELRHSVLDALVSRLAPAAIIERVDPRIRELEKLPALPTRVAWADGMAIGANAPEARVPALAFCMNGVRFQFDPMAGQKTGAFLDQRENYAAAARYAHGNALDCFCYHGGFALHLARACSSVAGVDSSRAALECAEANARLNGCEIEWIEANAFDLLKDYAAARREYDTVVLDPPAFARNRASVPTALGGYKELNLRALRMLRPNGILVTCSCSHHVSEADLLGVLASAALDAHRTVRILERRGASLDHPAILTIPETAYLKCIIGSVI